MHLVNPVCHRNWEHSNPNEEPNDVSNFYPYQGCHRVQVARRLLLGIDLSQRAAL